MIINLVLMEFYNRYAIETFLTKLQIKPKIKLWFCGLNVKPDCQYDCDVSL